MRKLLFISLVRGLLLVLTLSDRTSAVSQDANCYSPNGVIADGNYPCFLDQTQSACCGAGTICEASGLCKVLHSVGVSDLIRGTCTDSSWTSSECPQYCTDANTGGTNLISCQNVTKSDLDFCCDHTNGCCDTGIGRFQVQFNTDIVTLGSTGATISTSAPTGASSSSPASTSSTSSTSSSSISSITTSSLPSNAAPSSFPSQTAGLNTSTSQSSSGLSTGAIAGISVGCGLTSLALIGGLIYFTLRKRSSSNIPDYSVEKDDYATPPPPPPPPPQEMGDGTRPAELMTGERDNRIELSA